MTFFPSAAQPEFTPSNLHLPHILWLWVEDSQQSDSQSSVQSSFCSPRLSNKHWNQEKVLKHREVHSKVSIICDCPQSQLVCRVSHQIHPGLLPQAPSYFSERKEILRKNSLSHLNRSSTLLLSAHLNGRRNPSTVQTWTFPKRLFSSLSSRVFPILWNCKN